MTTTTKRLDCKSWLRDQGYDDQADHIATLEAKWKADGRKTRRDWWAVLAGRADGRPCVVGGVTFLVLRAARERQGLPPHADAVERKPGESAPPIREGGRWKVQTKRDEAAE